MACALVHFLFFIIHDTAFFPEKQLRYNLNLVVVIIVMSGYYEMDVAIR
jgi:hypothetical protein